MKTIVVSAVNLRKGGTLTILRECLSYLSELSKSGDYKIVALVHKKELAYFDGIEYIELPWSLKSWINRLWCEYVMMKRISKQLTPIYLWFSLHDTTPNVISERRAVYCHNPFPFYSWNLRELFFNYKIVLFSLFSKYIYRTNLHENNKVVVQQQWIRSEFIKMFSLKSSNVIVAKPPAQSSYSIISTKRENKLYKFIFASYSDLHKNFELLCRATRMLEQEIGTDRFRVVLTISGKENRYAAWLHKNWSDVKSLEFAGFMDKDTLYENYGSSDCLVFPSKVETWGLPISEFAEYKKPMLISDLPYAHETAAGCDYVGFFNPDSPKELMSKMKALVEGDSSSLKRIAHLDIDSPKADTWEELFNKLLL